jgi:CRISPR-associated exonuclease Cas4
MFTEDELLPISALQHLAFCERQWALIHLEQAWAENVLTAEGRNMHSRAHEDETEIRGDIRIARGLRIHSLRLGLVGMMDVVEFVRESDETINPVGKTAVSLPGAGGLWRPVPVEYKHGKPKPDNCDEIQLCAQAFCLEEMLDVEIPSGAIFYGRPRRRIEVAFDVALRQETEMLTDQLHKLNSMGETPLPVYSKKCPNCSLIDICSPKTTSARSTASRYIGASLRDMGFSFNRSIHKNVD